MDECPTCSTPVCTCGGCGCPENLCGCSAPMDDESGGDDVFDEEMPDGGDGEL